jgi:hypothetical protein
MLGDRIDERLRLLFLRQVSRVGDSFELGTLYLAVEHWRIGSCNYRVVFTSDHQSWQVEVGQVVTQRVLVRGNPEVIESLLPALDL